MEFKKYKIKDIGEVVGGATPLTKDVDNYDGDIAWITPNDLSNYNNPYISRGERNISQKGLKGIGGRLLPQGTVLFSSRAPIGYVAIAENELCTNQGFKSVIPNLEKATSEFLYYTLGFYKSYIEKKGSGTTFMEVSGSTMENIELPFPSLEEQKKIAKCLLKIDQKIALNTRMNAELEAMAKQLYDYWFVQFDFPDENGKPYKSSGGKMVYNEKLKREIPEGWEVKNMNQLAESFRGVTYNKEDLVSESENSILVLRGNNIPRSGQFAYDSNVAYIPREMVSVEQRINKGDIIITMSSGSKEHIGKCFMFQYDSKHTFGAFLSKFVPHEGCRYFVYLSMLSDYFKAFVKTTCNGTGINNLTIDTFNNVFFAVPNSAVLSEFENLTESIYNKVGLSHKIINDLTHLRDSLLPMLMNGQVTVE